MIINCNTTDCRTCEFHSCGLGMDKAGKWIAPSTTITCSACGTTYSDNITDKYFDHYTETPNYCPYCGSRNKIQAKKEQTEITEEDLLELEHRFGKWVRYVVDDMLSGKNERWIKESEE